MSNKSIIFLLYSKHIALLLFIGGILGGCSSIKGSITYNELQQEKNTLRIHEGILCNHSKRIKYKNNGKLIYTIILTEPVIVAQANKNEEWGYYQFPVISKSKDGTLIVEWQMQDDSHKSYGVRTEREYTPMMSKTHGNSWEPMDKNYNAYRISNNVILNDGSLLQFKTPPAKDIKQYASFPKSVAKKGHYSFYLMETLPEELQGLYFTYESQKDGTKIIHSKLYDSTCLRYAIDDFMPIVWWGNIKQLEDKSLVAGVYPAYYLNEQGEVTNGSVSFYQSNDGGYTWNIISKIPYIKDGIANVIGNDSFEEPTFEVLDDGSFICIMRSGATSPLYRTFSYDKGLTWSTPEPFTPNGVRPSLMKLKNGVLVLVSGRPGIQIRFSVDGGHDWTEAIDMLPFMNGDGSYTRDVSCGYASIIEADENSFYLVYSDFTVRNEKGEIRKTIWSRKIGVKLN